MVKEFWEDDGGYEDETVLYSKKTDTPYVKKQWNLHVQKHLYSRQFTLEEKKILKPIAETLAMLEQNALFSTSPFEGVLGWEHRLPEAAEIVARNGGPTGQAGKASWIQDLVHETSEIEAAYNSWRTLKTLSNA